MVICANKPKIILVGLFIFSAFFVEHVKASEREHCLEKIQRQGQLILVINRKATAMPPLTSVYVYANELWRKAIHEKDISNFKECNRILDVSIRYSEPYAR